MTINDDTIAREAGLNARVLVGDRGIRVGPHGLTKAMTLIAPLRAWRTPQGELVQDDRKSYRTWQYKGRQVLKLRVGSSGHVHLIAGVNYCDPHRGANP